MAADFRIFCVVELKVNFLNFSLSTHFAGCVLPLHRYCPGRVLSLPLDFAGNEGQKSGGNGATFFGAAFPKSVPKTEKRKCAK